MKAVANNKIYTWKTQKEKITRERENHYNVRELQEIMQSPLAIKPLRFDVVIRSQLLLDGEGDIFIPSADILDLPYNCPDHNA